MADIPYTSATLLTPGARIAVPSRGYRIACSSDGYFRLIMRDGSFYDVFASRGQGGEDDLSVVGVAASGAPSPAGVGYVFAMTGRA